MSEELASNNLDFSRIVSERYSSLTKSEKLIADYIRKNQDESAFLSAAELAGRLGLSEATLVRFARTLNFPSYPSLREVLQETFRQRVTHSTRLRGRLDELREAGDIFERLTVTEIDYLSQAHDSIDRNEMNKAVDLLRSRQKIFVFGLGPSITLVDLMEIRLRRFGKEIIPLRTSGREILESLLLMGPDDLLFVICFFDQNPTLKMVLEYGNQTGCPIILLTDTLDAILRDQADVILAARRGPIGEFHSLVVPMTIINAILLTIASEAQETIMPTLDKLDMLREQLKIFYSHDK